MADVSAELAGVRGNHAHVCEDAATRPFAEGLTARRR
jgi:hypothetical protein